METLSIPKRTRDLKERDHSRRNWFYHRHKESCSCGGIINDAMIF